MFKILIWFVTWLWWLFIAWNIYFTNESFASFLYWIFNLLLVIIFLWWYSLLCYIVVNMFWQDIFWINKVFWITLIFWFFWVWLILNYISTENFQGSIKNYANNISSNFEFEKWKMPIYNVK